MELDNNGDLTISADGADEILNKEEIKDYLVENTELSEAEINGVINKWDRKIEKAIDKAERYYAKVKKKVTKTADDVADATGKYGIIAFFIFLIGAGAAFAGGAIGSPFLTVEEEHLKEDRL